MGAHIVHNQANLLFQEKERGETIAGASNSLFLDYLEGK